MGRLAIAEMARALRWALVGGVLASTGCQADPDVVATVEALVDGGGIGLADPDAGVPTTGMPAAGAGAGAGAGDPMDPCSSGWVYAQLARVVAFNCEIPREDFTLQLITTISFVVGTVPVDNGEANAPDVCDFALFPPVYYPDPPTDATHFVLCPAYCEGLRQYVADHAPPAECLAP